MTRLLASLALALATAGAALGFAADAPALRSASQRDGHIVVVFHLPPSTAALELEVGLRPQTGVTGAFRSGVRLRERLAARGTNPVRWRTPKALPPDRYFVHVSAVDEGGVTSCIPRTASCLEEWSNVLRVVIPP
jgi:hypothetical protein